MKWCSFRLTVVCVLGAGSFLTLFEACGGACVCVGCWHLMKWCSLRLTVVCVCVSGAFVCFCRAGWRPRVGWWPRFCLVFRGSKGTVHHPGKAAFLEQFRLTVRWCSGKNRRGVFWRFLRLAVERVCVGCWHLTKWCSLRLTVACVCVSGAFVCFCRAGWRPRVGWWPRFCLVFRGSKGTVHHPGKAAFLEQFRLTVRWCSGKNRRGVFCHRPARGHLPRTRAYVISGVFCAWC